MPATLVRAQGVGDFTVVVVEVIRKVHVHNMKQTDIRHPTLLHNHQLMAIKHNFCTKFNIPSR